MNAAGEKIFSSCFFLSKNHVGLMKNNAAQRKKGSERVKSVLIAAGIIRNSAGEIFITQRPADTHMAGKWEFPGGKLEEGEAPEQALERELQEEIGIQITDYQLFDKIVYSLPDRELTIWFYIVSGWQGEPWGKEGQLGHWVRQESLIASEFPPANVSIVERLVQG